MNLTNPQIRKLKALAQRLERVVYVGKAGVIDELLASVERHKMPVVSTIAETERI